MKALLVALYERVFLAYRSTLLGILLACLTEIANYLQALPANWAHLIAMLLLAVLSLWKGKAAPPPAPAA